MASYQPVHVRIIADESSGTSRQRQNLLIISIDAQVKSTLFTGRIPLPVIVLRKLYGSHEYGRICVDVRTSSSGLVIVFFTRHVSCIRSAFDKNHLINVSASSDKNQGRGQCYFQ